MSKFKVGDILYAKGKGLGEVIEVAEPGEWSTGTTGGKETRYRMKWGTGRRTWFRESALNFVTNLHGIDQVKKSVNENLKP